jgi:hypothetical protein
LNVVVAQTFAKQPEYHLVGDQIASGHDAFGLFADLGLITDRLTQQVSGRNMWNIQGFPKDSGLSSLSGTWRAE